jgi:hypothetical protein
MGDDMGFISTKACKHEDDSLLATFAHNSAAAIVDRHARDREALVEAIARIVLLGLEGHVRLFEAEQSRPPSRIIGETSHEATH